MIHIHRLCIYIYIDYHLITQISFVLHWKRIYNYVIILNIYKLYSYTAYMHLSKFKLFCMKHNHNQGNNNKYYNIYI